MKKNREYDSVKMMRDIRNQIDKEIKHLNKEELKECFRKRSEKFKKEVSK